MAQTSMDKQTDGQIDTTGYENTPLGQVWPDYSRKWPIYSLLHYVYSLVRKGPGTVAKVSINFENLIKFKVWPLQNLMCKKLKMDYCELVTNHIQGWSETVIHDYRCKDKQHKEFLLTLITI